MTLQSARVTETNVILPFTKESKKNRVKKFSRFSSTLVETAKGMISVTRAQSKHCLVWQTNELAKRRRNWVKNKETTILRKSLLSETTNETISSNL